MKPRGLSRSFAVAAGRRGSGAHRAPPHRVARSTRGGHAYRRQRPSSGRSRRRRGVRADRARRSGRRGARRRCRPVRRAPADVLARHRARRRRGGRARGGETGDILADPRVRLGASERARLELAPYRAAVAVPLLARGTRDRRPRTSACRDGRTLDDEGRRLVEQFADQAAHRARQRPAARRDARGTPAARARALRRPASWRRRTPSRRRSKRAHREASPASLGWRAGRFWRVRSAPPACCVCLRLVVA